MTINYLETTVLDIQKKIKQNLEPPRYVKLKDVYVSGVVQYPIVKGFLIVGSNYMVAGYLRDDPTFNGPFLAFFDDNQKEMSRNESRFRHSQQLNQKIDVNGELNLKYTLEINDVFLEDEILPKK